MRWWVKEEHPNFSEQFLHEQDDAGNVVSVGYQWLEERKTLKLFWTLMKVFWIATAIYLLFAAVYTVPSSRPALRVLAFGSGIMNLWWFGWFNKHHPYFYRRRELIFYPSGRVSAPHGLPTHLLFPSTQPVDFQLANQIASIQSSHSTQMHRVNMYMANGERILIDHQRSRDGARELAVQLTRAYEELKAATRRSRSNERIVIN